MVATPPLLPSVTLCVSMGGSLKDMRSGNSTGTEFDSSRRMNLANSVPVESPDLVSFRDPPVETHNVTDGRSGGVATSIADKDRIWRPSPSDIGTAATHDDVKNINEKLAFRKYLNELDSETIQMLERYHRAR